MGVRAWPMGLRIMLSTFSDTPGIMFTPVLYWDSASNVAASKTASARHLFRTYPRTKRAGRSNGNARRTFCGVTPRSHCRTANLYRNRRAGPTLRRKVSTRFGSVARTAAGPARMRCFTCSGCRSA